MINARFMYLRPGNLFKDFVVESNTQVVTASGRVANAPKGDGSKIIRGCLAESTKEQKESHSTRDRVCTHTIVQAVRKQRSPINSYSEIARFTLSTWTRWVAWVYQQSTTLRKGRMSSEAVERWKSRECRKRHKGNSQRTGSQNQPTSRSQGR